MGQIDVHMRATLKEGYIHLALVPLLVYNIFTEIIAVLGENKITSAEMNTLMNMFILYFKYKEVIHAEYMTEFKMTFITSIQLALWQVKYKEKRRLLCCV
jgi:ABC-type antimicrobial peptide transport system permease subunit